MEFDMIAHVLMGVPGSGKSTWAKSQGLTIISSDDIREQMFGDLNNQNIYSDENHSKVFNKMREMVRDTKDKGLSFIWDSTNLSRKSRYSLYQFLKSLNFTVVLHVFVEPFNVIAERVSKRKENVVPYDLLKSMYKRFEPPRLADGVYLDCDFIQIHATTNFFKEEGYYLMDFFNKAKNEGILSAINLLSKEYYDEIIGIDDSHNSPYHLESIDEHIDCCIKNSIGDSSMEIVSIFHDLGKSFTKNNGKFYNHANVSSMYALACNFPLYDLQDSVEVIFQHMNAHSGISQKTINKHKLSEHELLLIEKFRNIDEKSRISGV